MQPQHGAQRHAEIARRSCGRTSAITLRELQLSDHARHCMQGKDGAPRDPRAASRRAGERGRTAAAPLIENGLCFSWARRWRAELRFVRSIGWNRSGPGCPRRSFTGASNRARQRLEPDPDAVLARGSRRRASTLTHRSRAASATEYHCRTARWCRCAITMPRSHPSSGVGCSQHPRAESVPNNVPTSRLSTGRLCSN